MTQSMAKDKQDESQPVEADKDNPPVSKDGGNRTNPDRQSGETAVRDDAPLASSMRLTPDAGEDVGEEEMQKKVDAETERGFRGAAADPTPNENYSVKGVTSGAPTPETSFAQRREARDARNLDEGVEPY